MLVVPKQEHLPVAQARLGTTEAWDALFKRYQLPLYVYVFELVGNEQASLDIVQETFINAARHIGSLQNEAKFGSWLFGIAHQRCIQLWRKTNRRGVSESFSDEMVETMAAEGDGPADLLIQREEEALFSAALDQLPPAHRSVLLLHFVEDFSLEEIAQITGAQLGTVKSRIHYAKKALRKLMEEHEL